MTRFHAYVLGCLVVTAYASYCDFRFWRERGYPGEMAIRLSMGSAVLVGAFWPLTVPVAVLVFAGLACWEYVGEQ